MLICAVVLLIVIVSDLDSCQITSISRLVAHLKGFFDLNPEKNRVYEFIFEKYLRCVLLLCNREKTNELRNQEDFVPTSDYKEEQAGFTAAVTA